MKLDTLKDCIATLNEIRDVFNGQLDASVLERLDAVISDLKNLESAGVEMEAFHIGSQALRVIADVLTVVTNISNLL